jgi:hypothetical protein
MQVGNRKARLRLQVLSTYLISVGSLFDRWLSGTVTDAHGRLKTEKINHLADI